MKNGGVQPPSVDNMRSSCESDMNRGAGGLRFVQKETAANGVDGVNNGEECLYNVV